MNKNIKSANIKIFPTSKRDSAYQAQARLITESNIINIVNRLVDKDSFVIKYDKDKGDIDFNIHGYWVHVDDIINKLSLASSDTNIYAKIKIDTIQSETQPEFNMINGKDINTVYTGVEFVSTPPSTATNTYFLHLLEKVGSTWQVPEDSWVKFTTSATTRSVTIDDGDLDPVQ